MAEDGTGVMAETEFTENKLNPAFEEVKAELGEDVVTMDKAQALSIAEKATGREKETAEDGTKTGGISQEEFDVFFNQMPKAKEDAEPIDFDSVKECILLFAISIKMIPTRLKTALNVYLEAMQQPERQMQDFFKNDALSDVTLVHPVSGALYKCHRVIVASGSRYMLEVFMKYGPSELPRVRVPEPYDQKNMNHSDDQVSRILKYIYANQNIGMIRDEVNEENFYSLYAQAQALGCECLGDDLRDLCMTSLLNERTVLKHYNDVVEHQDKRIMEACANIIMHSFSEIIDRGEEAIEQLIELEFTNFVDTLSSDNLSIKDEEILIEIVRRYISARDKAGPKQPTTAEQLVKPELWALLNEEERQSRQTAFEEELAKKKAEVEEAMLAEADSYVLKDSVDQIQHVLDIKQKERNLRIYEETFHKIKLDDEQKEKIMRCIRWQYLSQESLLKLSSDPDFVLAKSLIVQGLAIKLGGPEAVRTEDLKLTVKPRISMRNSIIAEAPIELGVEEMALSQNQFHEGVVDEIQQETLPVPPQTRNNIGRDIFMKMSVSQGQNFYGSGRDQEIGEAMSASKSYRPLSSMGGLHASQRMASPNSRYKKPQQQNLYASQANQRFQQVYQGQLGFQPTADMLGRTHGTNKQAMASRLLDGDIGGYEVNPMTGMPFANTMRRSPKAARPPQAIMSMMHRSEPPPTEFFFEYNFDENGVLYYLGTAGKRKNWQNPHTIGQVQAFASSIGQGCALEAFVGRTVQNCRTEDEPYSFFGVDLGMERRLLPTCYTLRNRKSATHVLRNWYFEGSVTGINWVILDARIYHSDQPERNASLEAEFKDFQKVGGAMTFTIDTEIYKKLGTEGYRFFRIVQVGKNTSATDNLTLSGIELYGRISGGPWQFM